MTGPYLWAWIVVVLAAPLSMYAFLRATRGLALPGARRALAWLIGLWLVLPAQVPGFPDYYAPAFLVFLLESLFQNDGKPRAAGMILVMGALVYAAGLLVWVLVRRLTGRTGARVA